VHLRERNWSPIYSQFSCVLKNIYMLILVGKKDVIIKKVSDKKPDLKWTCDAHFQVQTVYRRSNGKSLILCNMPMKDLLCLNTTASRLHFAVFQPACFFWLLWPIINRPWSSSALHTTQRHTLGLSGLRVTNIRGCLRTSEITWTNYEKWTQFWLFLVALLRLQ